MPSPAQLGQFYNSGYSVPIAGHAKSIQREFRSLLRVVSEHVPCHGSMFEVGCSYGEFLRRFRDLGWDVVGLEIDIRAAEVARARFGLSVDSDSLERVSHRDVGRYDVVMAHHVIEHIPDPIRFMSQLRRLLKPEGLLVIRTPNAGGWIPRISAGWWEWFAIPEHVQVFSPKSMRNLLMGTGFEVLKVESRRGDARSALFETIRGVAKRLVLYTPPHLEEPLEAGRRAVSARGPYRVAKGVLDVLSVPLDILLSPVYHRYLTGPELLVIARREEGK